MMTFRQFENLGELIEYVKAHKTVWYEGPMNFRPMVAEVRQYTENIRRPENSRVTVWTRENGCLVLYLAKHLDRFKCPVRENDAERQTAQCLTALCLPSTDESRG